VGLVGRHGTEPRTARRRTEQRRTTWCWDGSRRTDKAEDEENGSHDSIPFALYRSLSPSISVTVSCSVHVLQFLVPPPKRPKVEITGGIAQTKKSGTDAIDTSTQ
jgi:hypothetical protein